MQMTFLRPYAPYILSILRILAALSFFTHGTQKLFAWPAAFPYPVTGLLMTAAVLEVVGGLLLAIGLFTRPVAFVLAGLMAFAYFLMHNSSFFPILNGGEAAMLFCWLFLFIAAYGPGPISVDAQMGKA